MSLKTKIDFALIISVKNANPNGDPLNGNRPRTDYEGYGEISDVCLKRKIRDRLQERGYNIFVQSNEKIIDGMTSLKNRAYSDEHGMGKDVFNAKNTTPHETARKCCEKWFDVRSFGQIFAYKGDNKGEGISIPIRGPLTIQSAFSLEPVSVTSMQITKSVNNEGGGEKRGPDTMGMKHRIDEAVYMTFGSITPQLAERTGFSDQDAETIKSILPKLFEGDASSARPEGSMSVAKVIWWEHGNRHGQHSSAKVHQSLRDIIDGNGNFDKQSLKSALPNLEPQIIGGF